MNKDIDIEELLKKQANETLTLIDVRSPKEFKEATIPGAINIPVFNDEERAEVGTLYKQVGAEAAKERGLEIFSDKLPKFIAAFKEIDTPKTVFCWRGGMRSKTAATVLDLMGIHASRLSGGIRAYRQWVVHTLEHMEFKPDVIVLNGYTGSSKTWIIKRLSESGYPAIDLEGMAGHRGSIFGQIGLEPNNQKKFDALLLTELLRYQNEPFVIIEGESKRIGKVVLPEFLYKKKEAGKQIFIHLPIEERVAHIIEDYQPNNDPNQFLEAFERIKRRIHVPIAKEIEMHLKQQQFAAAVKLLLEYYYDPRYEHSISKSGSETVHIHASNPQDALKQLKKLLPARVQ